jgi:hypothetical protein
MFMGRVVVQHHMNLQIRRDGGVDLLEKVQPPNMPVALLALRDDAAIENIERREQCGRSIG